MLSLDRNTQTDQNPCSNEHQQKGKNPLYGEREELQGKSFPSIQLKVSLVLVNTSGRAGDLKAKQVSCTRSLALAACVQIAEVTQRSRNHPPSTHASNTPTAPSTDPKKKTRDLHSRRAKCWTPVIPLRISPSLCINFIKKPNFYELIFYQTDCLRTYLHPECIHLRSALLIFSIQRIRADGLRTSPGRRRWGSALQ